MASILRGFVNANIWLSREFDRFVRFPPASRGSLDLHNPASMFNESTRIGDVGGGKKPYAVIAGLDASGKTYFGLDLDADELAQAPADSYSETRVLDLCSPPEDLKDAFDLIICRSTLEHVSDTEAALAGLTSLLASGGRCYIKLPCRKALFAQLNLIIPDETKRRIMHAIFPHKEGDGFPALYDKATPSAIRHMARYSKLEVVAAKRNFR